MTQFFSFRSKVFSISTLLNIFNKQLFIQVMGFIAAIYRCFEKNPTRFSPVLLKNRINTQIKNHLKCLNLSSKFYL